ncbi:Fe-S cluster biogenesis protein NfuA [Saccharopolyspora erythraea NRRL 2338]|uniref:Nitrogen-fixing NifU-like n=2 Tax=Saccharopolyspora erythraea TaxID=1836 RepID=A4FE66_SACEN|nr:NifU family protein [Saccharopolyspora erythraea]EQD85192.1 nitrogen-fixing protein NifU [Saccharopolyspora erythraea D]PFG96068.1 Fe-S cluster biogenesis protein NfuA [Saccharopolyspora erythraea NRRL 2338]QRK92614.1 NifU family protein [Saccharopolyspora erythraea]CAM02341.1 nitrogen-fixing NifU-like [Saccharopolyspora erythraea NRRL 2338]
MSWDDEQAREHVGRVEALLSALESRQDAAGAQALEAVRALVALYGDCLARVLERVERSGDRALLTELGEDELVSHLLLVHDLHPVDTETRVRRVLAEVARFAGGGVELLSFTEGAVRVRIGSGGCGSTSGRLRAAVEDALSQAAPEVGRVEVVEEPAPKAAAVIPVEALFAGGSVPGGA